MHNLLLFCFVCAFYAVSAKALDARVGRASIGSKVYLPAGNYTGLSSIPCRSESGPGKACIWTRKRETLPGFVNVEVIAISGQPSSASDKYQLTNKPEEGDCTLNLSSVDEKDVGNYTCNIEAGVLKAEAEVIVKNVHTLLENIGMDKVKPGQYTKLVCSGIAFPGQVSYSISSVSANGQISELVRQKELETDKPGDYICHASSNEFPVEVPSNIVHLDKDGDSPVTQITGLLPVGSVGYLECKGPSGLGDTCIWERKRTDSDGNVETEIVVESGKDPINDRFRLNDDPSNGDCSLEINFAEKEDAGNYTCKIEPDVAETNVDLSVEAVTTHLEYSGPDKIKPGQSGRLTCTTTSLGKLENIKHKIYYKAFDGDDWSLFDEGDEVTVTEAGEYECQASGGNLLVTVQSNVVQVYADDAVEDELYIMADGVKLVHGTKYSYDFTGSQDIKLTCVFQGSETNPQFQWFVNGQQQQWSSDTALTYKESSSTITLNMKANTCAGPYLQSQPEYRTLCMEETSGKVVSVVLGKKYATTHVELTTHVSDINIDSSTKVESSLSCHSDGNPEADQMVFLYKETIDSCWEEISNFITVNKTGFYRCLAKNELNSDFILSNIVKLGLRKIN